MDEMLKKQNGLFYSNVPQLLDMTENNTCEHPYIKNKSPIQTVVAHQNVVWSSGKSGHSASESS